MAAMAVCPLGRYAVPEIPPEILWVGQIITGQVPIGMPATLKNAGNV